MAQSEFFTYKGIPLVRKGKEIYYGNMSDEYVVMLQILDTEKVGDLDVANKVRLFRMATDETLPPNERINKTAEKKSLYEALDVANAWLSRYVSK
ncbi:MAG: hypothetical protein LUH08_07635 [Ruminococcus sp.]|nr:hypothetical protein [Ruminococcus sp.]MCD7773911.1 hypothetical protein [Ruminococcus sp.]